MHPNSYSRRADRRHTSPARPPLHLLRAVLGLAPAGEPVPGLSRWRRSAQTSAGATEE